MEAGSAAAAHSSKKRRTVGCSRRSRSPASLASSARPRGSPARRATSSRSLRTSSPSAPTSKRQATPGPGSVPPALACRGAPPGRASLRAPRGDRGERRPGRVARGAAPREPLPAGPRSLLDRLGPHATGASGRPRPGGRRRAPGARPLPARRCGPTRGTAGLISSSPPPRSARVRPHPRAARIAASRTPSWTSRAARLKAASSASDGRRSARPSASAAALHDPVLCIEGGEHLDLGDAPQRSRPGLARRRIALRILGTRALAEVPANARARRRTAPRFAPGRTKRSKPRERKLRRPALRGTRRTALPRRPRGGPPERGQGRDLAPHAPSNSRCAAPRCATRSEAIRPCARPWPPRGRPHGRAPRPRPRPG